MQSVTQLHLTMLSTRTSNSGRESRIHTAICHHNCTCTNDSSQLPVSKATSSCTESTWTKLIGNWSITRTVTESFMPRSLRREGPTALAEFKKFKLFNVTLRAAPTFNDIAHVVLHGINSPVNLTGMIDVSATLCAQIFPGKQYNSWSVWRNCSQQTQYIVIRTKYPPLVLALDSRWIRMTRKSSLT